jgi:hypothetical protein
LGSPGQPAPAAPGSVADTGLPDGPGKAVLMDRCFQCHGQSMWKGLRQERRGWEAVLYRMVGRGALWTEEEIDAMAGYLASAFGPGATKRP